MWVLGLYDRETNDVKHFLVEDNKLQIVNLDILGWVDLILTIL